jgi:hypothetical protein
MDFAIVSVPSDGPTDPAAVATAYFDTEERRLRAVESLDPKNTTVRAARRSKTIGPYAVQYLDGLVGHVTPADEVEWAYDQHYLYFPPDFGSRDEYFAFVMKKVYGPSGMFSGTKEIQGVIKSFRDERPAAVSPALP